MGVLLLLTGLLGLASGGSKLRRRVRSTAGYTRWTVAETTVGAAVFIGSGLGLSQVRPLAWTAVGATLLLTVVSNWVHAGHVANYVSKREMSEEWRFKAFLTSSSSTTPETDRTD